MASPSDSIGYFFDEHVIVAVASNLLTHGIFVLTAFEAGRANREIADADQLAFATAHGLVFVSNDTDLLNPKVVPQIALGQHAGVVYCDQTVSIGQQALFLRFVAATMIPSEMAGKVMYYFPIDPEMFPEEGNRG